MRPLKLEFKGLNSFSEKAVIDFESLLKSGIFGIFGETGSGKSTILDAINFALYGDIERNPDKTDKINFRCDGLEVSFIFDIFSQGERKKYTVERSIKKKSGIHKAMLYEHLKDGSSVAIADNVKGVTDKITEIIGINKEDFRKCIALPQGEFAQFVNSASSERIELIERLFSLQKYGTALRLKLSAREKLADEEYNRIKGLLSAYSEDTSERLEQMLSFSAETQKTLSASMERAKTAEQEYNSKNKIFEEGKAYAKALERLKSLEDKKSEFEELKKMLPSLNLCEKAIQSAAEADRYRNQRDKLARQCSLLNSERQSLSEELNNSERALNEGNFDNISENLQKTVSAMESLVPVAAELSLKERELEKFRYDYKTEQKKCEEAARERKSAADAFLKAKSRLENMPQPDIEEYFKNQFKGGILKEEYAKSLDYFKDLQSGLKIFADGSALYEYVEKELGRKAEEYKNLILTVKGAKINVNEELEKFNKTLKERASIEKEVNLYKAAEEKNKILEEGSLEKLENLRSSGERLKDEMQTYKNRLAEVFGESCKDYSLEIKKKTAIYENVKNQKRELSEKIERIKAKISEVSNSVSSLCGQSENITEQIKSKELEIEDILKRIQLSDISACRSMIEKYGGYKQALESYYDFDKEYSTACNDCERYKNLQNYEEITAEEITRLLLDKNRVEEECKRLSGELAVFENQAASLRKRLEEKKEIEKKFHKSDKERDLIGRLKSLIQANKFMEYIANEHLVNISRSASKTLIELTDGRYFLEYVDNNFYVGDNYNGGERRKVRTLSGGETFLVSLSLALALSSTICTRSLKSIEFFFLDEGFGTLDGDHIEVVLDALEKLKSANFSIGLISHVEELKHRITSKIIVNKATETRGSTVKISC